MIGYIYCIRNSINNKLYVGKTTDSLVIRFKEHCKACNKRNLEARPLYRAMRKYGKDKFSIHLIEEVDVELLSERESYWINQLDTYKNGYNATHGGDGKMLYDDEDTKKFIRDYQNGMTTKDIALKYHCSDVTVRKRLKAEGIDTNTNALKRKTHRIAQYDRNGNQLAIFDSQKSAAQHLIDNGIGSNLWSIACHIGEAAKGTRPSCMGYIWKFV